MSESAVSWSDREPPLVPCAVVAGKDAARRLAERLLAMDDTALARLSGVASQTHLVVLGEESDLPWVDGVSYLGQDPRAPSLLLPTQIEPVVPAANLFERALRKRFANLSPPLAILPETFTVISCHRALRISRDAIETWIGGETS